MEQFEAKLAELESKLTHLLVENETLRKSQLEGLKKQYEEICNAIMYAVDCGDRLDEAYKNFEKEISKDTIFVDVADVNNPTSDVLGFEFIKTVNQLVELHFTKKITNQEVKEKFGTIVSKTINNPLIAALLSSNPVTGMIYRVVDKITDFSNNNPTGIRLNKWVAETKDVFEDENIKKFTESLSEYENFYGQLCEASAQYKITVAGLKQRRESLGKVLKTYYADLLHELGIQYKEGVSVIQAVNRLLHVNNENYDDILNNTKIAAAYIKAKDYRSLEERFNNLRFDYNDIMLNFFDTYVDALKNAKITLKADLNPQKVDDMIRKFEEHKSSIKLPA